MQYILAGDTLLDVIADVPAIVDSYRIAIRTANIAPDDNTVIPAVVSAVVTVISTILAANELPN
jgi:hypothetical protein